eukprot:g881.t1
MTTTQKLTGAVRAWKEGDKITMKLRSRLPSQRRARTAAAGAGKENRRWLAAGAAEKNTRRPSLQPAVGAISEVSELPSLYRTRAHEQPPRTAGAAKGAKTPEMIELSMSSSGERSSSSVSPLPGVGGAEAGDLKDAVPEGEQGSGRAHEDMHADIQLELQEIREAAQLDAERIRSEAHDEMSLLKLRVLQKAGKNPKPRLGARRRSSILRQAEESLAQRRVQAAVVAQEAEAARELKAVAESAKRAALREAATAQAEADEAQAKAARELEAAEARQQSTAQELEKLHLDQRHKQGQVDATRAAADKAERERSKQEERLREQHEAGRKAASAREEEEARLAQERAAADAAARARRVEEARLAKESAAAEQAEEARVAEEGRLARVRAAVAEAERQRTEEEQRLKALQLAAQEAAQARAEEEARLAQQQEQEQQEHEARLEREREQQEHEARLERERVAAQEAAQARAEEEARLAQRQEQEQQEHEARLERERVAAQEAAQARAEEEPQCGFLLEIDCQSLAFCSPCANITVVRVVTSATLLQLALDSGLSIDTVDAHGNSLLIIAAQNNQPDLVELLARSQADLNKQNKAGNTALHYAFAFKFKAVQNILDGYGADDSIANSNEPFRRKGP